MRADMGLDGFHHVIQCAMGWENSHLHRFIVGQTSYTEANPEMEDEMLDESEYTISQLAPRARKKFHYEYDFGDSWNHELLVEKVLPPDPTFKHPVCVAGANACPPEDCGGMPGYYETLAALANPKHPDHADRKEWIGGEWDAEWFDLDGTNAALKHIRA